MSVSIVTVEEQVRGWLAEVNRHRDPHLQISPYAKLQRQIEVFADWIILPWDIESASMFLELRREGLRIGSLDLKIACIVLAHGATLLTRNATDFAKVPGLPIENWLE
jgi:tRNA(fMet)-specific endonuclease VapC